MPPTKKLKVFLCHTSADKPAVRDLYKRLLVEGFDPWLDEVNLLPGQEWQLEIPNAVRHSDVVIVCLSKKSISKEGYVQKEIKFALDTADEKPEGTIFIIPLKLEECEVPRRLSDWQWLDYFSDKEKGIRRLSQSLKLRFESKQKQHKLTPNLPEGVKTYTYEGVEFIPIPSGSFLMGSIESDAKERLNEFPQHKVNLQDYYISRYPIANWQFAQFIQETNYVTIAEKEGGRTFGLFGKVMGINWMHPRNTQDNIPNIQSHPVVQMTWIDAQEYCKWLTRKIQKDLPVHIMRVDLPSEAQWEKAARGVLGNEWTWGNEFNSQYCNCAESQINQTTPVGLFSPDGDSVYGVADMAGNVQEWCRSQDVPYPFSNSNNISQNNLPPTTNELALRGGNYNSPKEYTRSASRVFNFATFTNQFFGFRVVITIN